MRTGDEIRVELFRGKAGLIQSDAGLIQIMDAAFADAAARAGGHLLCRPGCTQCCHGPFAINALDALRLRQGMAALRRDDPGLAMAVERRAASYRAEWGPSFPGDLGTGVLDASDQGQQAFAGFADEAACPALDPESGRCDLYAARPMTCRVFGPPVRVEAPVESDGEGEAAGFAVCELCFTEATPEQVAAAEMQVPREEEDRLLERLAEQADGETGETIVAFCLLAAPAASAPR